MTIKLDLIECITVKALTMYAILWNLEMSQFTQQWIDYSVEIIP